MSFANVHINLETEAKELKTAKERIMAGMHVRKFVAAFDLVAW